MFKNKFEYLILGFLLCVYIVFSVQDISLPGVNFDEAFTATASIKLLNKEVPSNVFTTDAAFFGLKLPLMTSSYDAALGTYLLLPSFFIFDYNVSALRGTSIFFGVLALFFVFLFVRSFFNRQAALLTVLLLVVSPNFIILNKLGNYYLAYIFFFSLAAQFFLFKWYKSGRVRYFVLGTFLLGLGLSTSICFAAPAVVLALLFFGFKKDITRQMCKSRIKSFWAYLALGGIFFCLGSFLYLYANFINKSTAFMTLRCIADRFLTTSEGLSNLNYLDNLFLRVKNFEFLLGNQFFINQISGLEQGGGKAITHFVLLFSFSFLLISAFFRKNIYFSRKRILFILAYTIFVFMVTPFVINGMRVYHMMVLIPYIQIIMIIGLIEFQQAFRDKATLRVFSVIVSLVVTLLVGYNLVVLREGAAAIRKTGGSSVWSDAIYPLADWLKENRPSKVIALSWGFSRNLYFLLEGKQRIYDLHASRHHKFNEKDLTRKFNSFLKDKKVRYLVNRLWEDQRAFELFNKLVVSQGKSLIKEKMFYQRDGNLVFIVYAVE